MWYSKEVTLHASCLRNGDSCSACLRSECLRKNYMAFGCVEDVSLSLSVCPSSHPLVQCGLRYDYFLVWVVIQYFSIDFLVQIIAVLNLSVVPWPVDTASQCRLFLACLLFVFLGLRYFPAL